MLSVSRRFRDILVDRGYDVGYDERPGGHDCINWQQGLARGVTWLLQDAE